MNVIELFTKKNIEILQLLDKESLHMREIAQKLDISPAKVHASIQLFKEHGLVSEQKKKNKIIISLNKNNALLEKIHSILNPGADSHTEQKINLFDTISPLDYRYYGRSEKAFQDLSPYLSESAMVQYMAKVEVALTRTLAKRKICSKKIADEVASAAKKVTAFEVYAEEDRLRHNVRALVNCIRDKVSDDAKPYVHFTTTSHDIIATADAYRFKECTADVIVPILVQLQNTLIKIALREKDTIQVGRTHGQHAVPITFGFAIAQYVSRLGRSILQIKAAGENLRGKIAGAVGAYNASSLFFDDPQSFEEDVLKEIKLRPSPISTQIPQAEYMTDYVHSLTTAFGIIANIADDMRHLQRSEISEVAEEFAKKQVGSSTMPQKRNPINFENVKSMWKVTAPKMQMMYADQISEHQRDLTGSASSRFVAEVIASLYLSVQRLEKTMSKLVVDQKNLQKNFDMNEGLIVAEPLYILLAAHGHPDAHEAVRELTLEAQKKGKPLQDLIQKQKSLSQYYKKFNTKQRKMISKPENYIGISRRKTEKICGYWKKKLKL